MTSFATNIFKASFTQDSSIRNCNKLARIGLAFTRDRFQLELILGSCAGDTCLAGMQDNSRRAEKEHQSLSFGSTWNRATHFRECGSNWDLFRKQARWNQLTVPNGTVPRSSLEVRNLPVPGMTQFQLQLVLWKCNLKLCSKLCYCDILHARTNSNV